jgi:hypothetical protein
MKPPPLPPRTQTLPPTKSPTLPPAKPPTLPPTTPAQPPPLPTRPLREVRNDFAELSLDEATPLPPSRREPSHDGFEEPALASGTPGFEQDEPVADEFAGSLTGALASLGQELELVELSRDRVRTPF